jgi:RimJ/RimL family protein N-acetyltransferase
MQKLGMKHEGMQREYFLKGGELIDIELYAILKSEYEPGSDRNV